MTAIWRLGFIVAAAISLAGCERNAVHSLRPLFGHGDAARDRPASGVWAERQANCVFDPQASMKTWPGCAGAEHLTGEEFRQTESFDGYEVTSLLAAGDPLILQTRLDAPGEDAPRPYDYAAVRALRRDLRGRVVEYETWTVLCGPGGPAQVNKGADGKTTPIEDPPPPPGIVRDDHDRCWANDAAAVRGAAAMTRDKAWSQPIRLYWVRPFRFRDNFGHPPEAPASVAPPAQSG